MFAPFVKTCRNTRVLDSFSLPLSAQRPLWYVSVRHTLLATYCWWRIGNFLIRMSVVSSHRLPPGPWIEVINVYRAGIF